jgi:TRAP-type C4-dicarboxylate transport system substrate-binding protein
VVAITSGLSLAARSIPRIGVGYYPFTFRDANHLLARSKIDAFAELAGMYEKKTSIHITVMNFTVRGN